MSFAAARKIKKDVASLSAFEKDVANALKEMETDNSCNTKMDLLYINSAREIELGENKLAGVIYVPVPFLNQFKKDDSIVRSLEKKLSGHQIFIVGDRTIALKQTRGNPTAGQAMRNRSRTLTSVHEALLDDICYPNVIVGKRTLYKVGAARKLQVFINSNSEVADRLKSFSKVYKTLTSKDTEFCTSN